MPLHLNRRDVLRSAWASTLGAGMALAGWPAAAAPTVPPSGKVLFGFLPDSNTLPLMSAVLKEVQGRYRPDLGDTVTPMPGNSSGLALRAVHDAPADGSTVLLTPSTIMTLLPHLRTLPGVDAVTDFIPVAAIGEVTTALAIGPAVPASVKSMKDYLRWVSDSTASVNYGIPGLGTAAHFIGVALSRVAGVSMRAVAYKSVAAQADDLAHGNLPAALIPITRARAAASEGQVRLLAINSDQRWPGLPELSTMAELGVPDATAISTYGFFARADTPAAKVGELREAIRQANASDSVRAALVRASWRPLRADTDDYPALITRERLAWGEMVKKYRFSMDS